MTIFSTHQEIVNRSRADVKIKLPTLDPSIDKTVIGALVDSTSNRHYDQELAMQQMMKELFPSDESTMESIKKWANYENLTPFVAKQGRGTIVFQGTVGGTITAGVDVATPAGVVYSVDSTSVIANASISVTLTRSGTTVTATASASLPFASSVLVTIAGANETDYNGTFAISVTSDLTFTYEALSAPSATPATGTITADCDIARVAVTAEDYALSTNISSGGTLSLATPITDVDDDAYVEFIGIIGGRDVETKSSLLRRTKHSRSNPVANYNVAAVEKALFAVQGITRIFVKRVYPDPGEARIFFLRDDDAGSILPDATEVAEAQAVMDGLLPLTTDEDDVLALAPTAVTTSYTFSALSPDTATMRTAITNTIDAFYADEATFETDITEVKYNAIISNTIDPDTGDSLADFTLSSPSGDITVGLDSIGIFGGATYP